MDNAIQILQGNRSEIIQQWITSLLPEYSANSQSVSEVEKPLLYFSSKEFHRVFDFLLNPTGDIPVAELFIKYQALNSNDYLEVVNYPLKLKELVHKFLHCSATNSVKGGGEIPLNAIMKIDEIIDRLLLAAFAYFTKTREQIFNIKLKELQNGTFINEASGCPSSVPIMGKV